MNKRYSPKTECLKKPRQVCGPGPCPLEPAPEECREETKTVRLIKCTQENHQWNFLCKFWQRNASLINFYGFYFIHKTQVTQEVPEETCDLQPEKVCKHVTKMVPM